MGNVNIEIQLITNWDKHLMSSNDLRFQMVLAARPPLLFNLNNISKSTFEPRLFRFFVASSFPAHFTFAIYWGVSLSRD